MRAGYFYLFVILVVAKYDSAIANNATEGYTDNNKSCSYWAERGECERRTAFMLTNCRKSCDLHDDKCKYWAERGVCENNPAYMLRNCQRSCSRQGWKSTVNNGQSDLIPHNLEEYPLHLYVTRKEYKDHTSSSKFIIKFHEPQGLKRSRTELLQLHLKFEREGISFVALSTICPPPPSSYDFFECPILNNGWLLLISKHSDSLKLDCNGNHTVSFEARKNQENCSVSEAERNFAWTSFQYVNPRLNSLSLYYKTPSKGFQDIRNCSTKEIGTRSARYLKRVCLYDGIEWYKCHNSNEFYTNIYDHMNIKLTNKQKDSCYYGGFNALCSSDPYFYQACGHHGCAGVKVTPSGYTLLCSTYVCQKEYNVVMGENIMMNNRCHPSQNCINTAIDDKGCTSRPQNDNLVSHYTCSDRSKRVITLNRTCDLVCDCHYCDDESYCDGISYGKWCNRTDSFGSYVTAHHLCDGPDDCLNKEDELNCTGNHVVRQCNMMVRNLTALQICAVPRWYDETCRDGLDQVNCTDASRVALGCEIGGYKSDVSVFAICKGYGLCDDGYDDNCFEIENGCRVHKNLLCDGFNDCQEGSDEENEICLSLSTNNCKRRLNPRDGNRNKSLQIPLTWVFDGVEDCENGEDENVTLWQECGKGRYVRYFDKGTTCEDVLLCDDSDKKGYIMFSELCDKINTCGSENQMCQKSRGHFLLGGKKLGEHKSHKSIHYCLPGLKELTKIGPTSCTYGRHFEGPSKQAYFAFKGTFLDIPDKERSLDCSYTYGETYVYLSCSNICKNTACPLKPIKHDTCNNHVDKRVYSITEDNTLTVLYRQGHHYHDKIFSCDNKNCVLYENVCNLVDDCGDGSDEKNCSNHFNCSLHNEYIPHSAKCDGFVHCRDFSDECNSDCPISKRLILPHISINIASWILGSIAILLNIHVFFKMASQLSKSSSFQGRMNKILVALVAVGDFLMGCYLVAIASFSYNFGDKYCTQKYTWLSSLTCAVLGMLNCIATQISMFSMTFLSVFRMMWVGQMIPSAASSRKAYVKMASVILVIVLSSVLIAVLPVTSRFEDFFVNGLFYPENPLFTASVSKKTHNAVIEAHYGRFNKDSVLSWRSISGLVELMFTRKYGGVHGRTIHFYGNDGVCVFKYLVTPEDPQKWYTISTLIVNSICLGLICFSYLTVGIKATISAKNSASNSNAARKEQNDNRDRRMQMKISAIILTDLFCWVPFTIVCFLHFGKVIDATPWYPIFSVIAVPINSVINPFLYGTDTGKKMVAAPIKFIKKSSKLLPSISRN